MARKFWILVSHSPPARERLETLNKLLIFSEWQFLPLCVCVCVCVKYYLLHLSYKLSVKIEFKAIKKRR